jgi:uncharacterized sporulation protein YeaH/YhbH (DUF444 family)
MTGCIIIDRRKNPKDKSLSNRQRFFERAKKAVREAAKRTLAGRSLSDTGDAIINIPTEGLGEPHFHHDNNVGEYDIVLPGNRQFIVGDKIKKQQDGEGGGRGSGGNGEGGEDDFQFALTHEEFLDVIFDDLELPDLIKKTERNAVAFAPKRAGHTNVGMPSNLNVEKTAIAGIARRLALRAPKKRQIRELEDEYREVLAKFHDAQDSGLIYALTTRLNEIITEVVALERKMAAVGFLDDVDLRYNNFVQQPKPITQAVMFCIMDVSFSMGEREKIIAKKFFILMNLFLKRRYENIDVVFVRHHSEAIECDEETFFTSREGGGTVVSSGYRKMIDIMKDRYASDDWNIYMAQASDGDNYDGDNGEVTRYLSEEILPVIQHFTYIEIVDEWRKQFFGDPSGGYRSNLWQTIDAIASQFENVSAAMLEDESEVIRVFRNLFKSEKSQ